MQIKLIVRMPLLKWSGIFHSLQMYGNKHCSVQVLCIWKVFDVVLEQLHIFLVSLFHRSFEFERIITEMFWCSSFCKKKQTKKQTCLQFTSLIPKEVFCVKNPLIVLQPKWSKTKRKKVIMQISCSSIL